MDKRVIARDAAGGEVEDFVAEEEPLQIVVDGHPLAVTMRTPGEDAALALGFLLTEGVIASQADVRRIDAESRPHHAFVFLAEGVEVDLSRLSRHVFSASSCGLCGKATIDAVLGQRPRSIAPLVISPAALLAAPAAMEARQAVFERTGGLHAAALFSAAGELLDVCEDIGRHNAVDKVLGHALAADRDLSRTFLLVSGRLSFEILQKALAGGIPVVAGVSAPSSLAVEFARESRQTLVGFLRPPRFRVYAGQVGEGSPAASCPD